jgi:hypothetical protein
MKLRRLHPGDDPATRIVHDLDRRDALSRAASCRATAASNSDKLAAQIGVNALGESCADNPAALAWSEAEPIVRGDSDVHSPADELSVAIRLCRSNLTRHTVSKPRTGQCRNSSPHASPHADGYVAALTGASAPHRLARKLTGERGGTVNRLREYRERYGMTQMELAAEVHRRAAERGDACCPL